MATLPSVQAPEYRDCGDAVEGGAAEIVREAEIDLAELALARAPQQLRIDLERHAQARRANGMTEALQPAIDLARLRAVAIEPPIADLEGSTALVREAEVLHRHEF